MGAFLFYICQNHTAMNRGSRRKAIRIDAKHKEELFALEREFYKYLLRGSQTGNYYFKTFNGIWIQYCSLQKDKVDSHIFYDRNITRFENDKEQTFVDKIVAAINAYLYKKVVA